MTVELDRKGLETLVRGTSPHYNLFKDTIIKRMGDYYGGFLDDWKWQYDFPPDITDEQLFEVYQKCRNSWA
jgi:hypothetical protein